MGYDFLELWKIILEAAEDFLSLRRIGQGHMLLDQLLQLQYIILVVQLAGRNHFLIQPDIQIPVFIQYISDAAAHAGCKVLSGRAQNHHPSSGHIFAAMVTHSLYYRTGAGVAYAETFACHTVDKGLAAGGSVEGHIADDDVVLCPESAACRRIDDQLAAGQSFPKIIVALSCQLQGEAPGDEGAEALSSRPSAEYPVGILLHPVAQPFCDF